MSGTASVVGVPLGDQRPTHALPLWLRPSALASFVLVLTVLRLLTAANADLVNDEAYYRLWGLYPALGYFDHPPMIAWWIWLGQLIAGDTALGLRIVGVLSLTLATPFLWRTAYLLFDARVAGLSVLFVHATFLIGTGVVIMTPDTPAVFFWGMTMWALAELHASGRANWWLAVGLFAGLGIVSKYSGLFIGAGIVLWLLMPANRHWFGRWQLWAGGLLALAIFAPVVHWNAVHEWPSFYKQFGRSVQANWTGRYVPEFIAAFAGLLNPLIGIAHLGGLWILLPRTFRGDAKAGLVVMTSLPFVIYLFIHAMHSLVEGNWPAPLFMAHCMSAAVFIAAMNNRFWDRFAIAAIALGVGLGLLVQMHAVSPFTGALGRQDPTHQMRGWGDVRQALLDITGREDAAYILTTNFQLNGQLAFALRDELLVTEHAERIRYVMMPEPPLDLFERPGLYVAEGYRDCAVWLLPYFETVELIEKVSREIDGTQLDILHVHRLTGPKQVPLAPIDPLQWQEPKEYDDEDGACPPI